VKALRALQVQLVRPELMAQLVRLALLGQMVPMVPMVFPAVQNV
jgi:hypothetical protein